MQPVAVILSSVSLQVLADWIRGGGRLHLAPVSPPLSTPETDPESVGPVHISTTRLNLSLTFNNLRTNKVSQQHKHVNTRENMVNNT